MHNVIIEYNKNNILIFGQIGFKLNLINNIRYSTHIFCAYINIKPRCIDLIFLHGLLIGWSAVFHWFCIFGGEFHYVIDN